MGNRQILRLAAFACLFTAHALAQTSAGMIIGQVLDSQGGAIANADVVLVDEQTSVRTSTKAEASGNFFFPSVQPGKYRVTVEAPGFKRFEKRNITLTSTERLSLGT